MASDPRPGRCVILQETSSKQTYAVILAEFPKVFIIARGTSNAGHESGELIFGPIQPRSRAANRWQRPSITTDTYFYRFDIRPVPRAAVTCERVRGFCEEDLHEALVAAMNELIDKVIAGHAVPRWDLLPREELLPIASREDP